jgi:ubiquinone biosynthesis protein UbiJ
MNFYFDENFSHYLSSALNELEKAEGENHVLHVVKEFSHLADDDGAIKDEELIPALGKLRGVLMTKDKKMTTRAAQHALLKKHHVSAFFFSTPTQTHWEQIEVIIRCWRTLTKTARRKRIDENTKHFTVKSNGKIIDWDEE